MKLIKWLDKNIEEAILIILLMIMTLVMRGDRSLQDIYLTILFHGQRS